MGKQQKLKASRRAARALKKADEEEQKKLQAANPPDLGVYAAETIQTADKFGG